MDTSQEREQWTHEEVVVGARKSLLLEFEIEDSDLGSDFLASPVGPRVRVGGVRSSLARFAAEKVAAVSDGVRYGGFTDASDEVVIHLPGRIEVRDDLHLPVLSSLSLKLRPFVTDVAARGPAAVGADLLARKS